jgi:anthranilate synthase component 1
MYVKQLNRIFTLKDAGTDPYLVFLTLRKLFPRAFFFQSNSTNHFQSIHRPVLTIIGLEADERICIKGGRAERFTSSTQEILSGAPLEIISEKLNEYYSPNKSAIPYENGGAFGSLGYDLVREIEPRLKKSGYFKKLAQNSDLEAEMLFVKNLIVFDHEKQQIHVILKSLLGYGLQYKEQILNIIRESSQVNPIELKNLDITKPSVDLFKQLTPSMGRIKFKSAVSKIKEHITEGDIFQAVLAERMEYQLEQATALEIFSCLRKINPAAYSFFFQFEGSEYFGASPETLAKVAHGKVETHPIAGTRPRGQSRIEDLENEKQLINCPKEAAEHLMLVDLARNDIGRIAAPGSVDVSTFRKVMRLANVMHLSSVVVGKLNKKYSAFDVLKACFPAGTLSGAPKIRAMEILAELESVPRGFYGGAIVAFDFCGDLDSCIAIRAIEVNQGQAILRAGAGIVADSDPEKEYQEVEHKMASMLKAIDIAENAVISVEKINIGVGL